MKFSRLALPPVALLALLALSACSPGTEKKKNAPPPAPVTTAKAVARDIPVTLSVVGRAEAYESVALKSRVDGQVAEVRFTEGQHVKKGELLIQLDPADLATRLQQAAATRARDAALLDKTRADIERYTALRERNFVSEEKVNEVRTNAATATANLRASQAAEDVARLQASYTAIRAPFDGIVGARVVFPGSAVKVNDTVLAVVNRVRPLLVSFSVPEKHLTRLRAALKAGPALKADVTLPSDGARHYSGDVRFIDNAVDAASGTILLKATLANEDETLTPGQFVNVTLLLETLDNAVSVPREAVQQGADGNFVYVLKDDDRVDVRKVETAAASDGMVAIAKGLALGETVVTDGQLRLSPGAKVKVRDARAARAADDAKPATPAPAAK